MEVYNTVISNVTITGTMQVDSSGNSTAFTGNGIGIVAQHSANYNTRMYNIKMYNCNIYNMEHGIYIGTASSLDYVTSVYCSGVYLENCYIGIYDLGFTSTFIGYIIQTKVNNLYGVYTSTGYFLGGRVYDLDFYYEGNDSRANAGHPRIGYFIYGGLYGYITDPVFTEYQGKYGYDWDVYRADKKFANIQNTWKLFHTPNESIYALNKDGTTPSSYATTAAKFDFNGMMDNVLCFADEHGWTITTNIEQSDIVSGSLNDIFNPFKDLDSAGYLELANVTSNDPYTVTIDFGAEKTLSAIGIDFHCIPRFVKMEAYRSAYVDTTDTGNKYSDDYYMEVLEQTENRYSVVQSTWSGSGFSKASKIRFSFAAAATNEQNTSGTLKIKNLYGYSVFKPADVYMPSIGGKLYNDGKITVDAAHEFTDDNEYVSKSYIQSYVQDTALMYNIVAELPAVNDPTVNYNEVYLVWTQADDYDSVGVRI